MQTLRTWKLTSQLRSTTLLLMLALMIAAGGCRRGGRGADQLAEGSSAAQSPDTNLTFNNLTLDQADDRGQTLWKIKAQQATYTPDQKIAKVKNPYGELYEDGKPVYRIQAQQGEVQQDGQRIVLTGEVIATDTENGAVLRGNELEWHPKQDTLVVRGNVRGAHPKVKMVADEAKVFKRQQRMELSGKVTAITADPEMQLKSDHVVWQMKDQKIISDRPVQIQRIQGKQATDQANANLAEVNLATKTVNLKQNARVVLLDPPVVMTSNSLTWNLAKQTLAADEPLTAVHRQQQVTVTANRGRMDLKPKIAYLNGNVHATAQENQSDLTADNLTWNIPSKRIEAEGNVVYNQTNPPATLKGSKAVGKLNDRTVVVSGGDGSGRVVTEIVPQKNMIPGG
jgi:LPS export ABC transporter protein LptC